MKESKHQDITDLGLSEDEMDKLLKGARVAFGSPDEYNNAYPDGVQENLSGVQPPRQIKQQRSKVKKHA